MNRLTTIVGSELSQLELLALREGLFQHILPRATRQEKRLKSNNVMSFEMHQSTLLPFLAAPAAASAVIALIFEMRQKASQREKILLNFFGLSSP
jgi:hypothetical protein